MTAFEALTGLVLITWTASFTFLVMQKNWVRHEPAPSSRSSRADHGPDERPLSGVWKTRPKPPVKEKL